MAQLYRANGEIEDYPEPANGTHYSLEEMRQAIGGGYIQIVGTNDNRLMVIDEEGKLKEFPINAQATRLYQHGATDPIVGDALVCDPDQLR